MRIEYSKSIDALYIRLREAEVCDSMDIEEGVTVENSSTALSAAPIKPSASRLAVIS
jgi:hypothetical protein